MAYSFSIGETKEQTKKRKEVVSIALKNYDKDDKDAFVRKFRPSDFKKEFWMPDMK